MELRQGAGTGLSAAGDRVCVAGCTGVGFSQLWRRWNEGAWPFWRHVKVKLKCPGAHRGETFPEQACMTPLTHTSSKMTSFFHRIGSLPSKLGHQAFPSSLCRRTSCAILDESHDLLSKKWTEYFLKHLPVLRSLQGRLFLNKWKIGYTSSSSLCDPNCIYARVLSGVQLFMAQWTIALL